jgi:hypothetical protein
MFRSAGWLCHASGVGWKEFAAGIFGDVLVFLASITGSVLSWPVAFVIAVGMFYKPIRGLIGRVKSGKVAGVEFEIREELQEAGDAALDAIREASESERGRPDVAARETTELGHEPPGVPAPAAIPSAEVGENAEPSKRDDASSVPNLHAAIGWSAAQKLLEAGEQIFSEGSIYDAPLSVRRSGEAVGTILWYYNRLESAIRDLYRQVAGNSAPDRISTSRMVVYLARRGILNDSFIESFDSLRRIRNEVAHGQAKPNLADARDFGRTASRLQALVMSQVEESDATANPQARQD